MACVYASHRHVTWRLAEGSLSPPPSVQEEPAPAQDGRVFSLCIPLAFQRQGSAGQPRVLWEMSFKFSLLLSPAAWLPGPSCHWMGCGKTALVSRADISICLPDSSDARKLHQDFISPPPLLSNTQPCLAPVSLALQQVTDYIAASTPSLQVGPLNPEDQLSTASPELLREGNHSSYPQAKLGTRPPF